MREHPIVVTESDARRLRGLLGAQQSASMRDHVHLQELSEELERAAVVECERIPADVVRLHARVVVLDLTNDERIECELVLPGDADASAGRISVLAPLGTALLGYRAGDEVEWIMPGGRRRLRIERVMQR